MSGGPAASDVRDKLLLAWDSHRRGDWENAAQVYRDLLTRAPDDADVLHLFGVLEAQRGRFAEAVDLIARAIARNPFLPSVHYNYGNALRELGRHEEALASYERALAAAPNDVPTLTNRGTVLQEMGQYSDALASFDRALAVDPANRAALFNRGNVLRHLGRYADAFAAYNRVLAASPRHAGALDGCGAVLQHLHRQEEAFAALDQAFSIDPGFDYLEGRRLHAKMHICNWAHIEEEMKRLSAHILAGKRASEPFPVLAASSSPDVQLQCAQVLAADRYPPHYAPLWRGERYAHKKIRLAYLSGEFREQATSYLTAGLFECHEKRDFELYAIATGEDDRSAMRRRLEGAFDVFSDMSAQTDSEIAAFIRRSEIDILVNLNGYFGLERTRVFARRPCPVQVNYLGFPGTMGAEYMDYIVADRTVIPEDQQRHYAEAVVYLPDTYQPSDSKRPVAAHAFTRAECSLPEQGFVFSCFNNNHKLTPALFDIWMRLLQRVDGSVLWLFQGNSAVERNLKAEAEKRGVSGDRLRFARTMSLADHLARGKLADLFLDTLPHNAHTTASDALWCGVPVVTCLGTTFAGRVAASLLAAVGLPELITHSLPEYASLALRLALEPGLLGGVRAKLARHRDTYPLFATQRFTRHIETAYRTMWERCQRGEAPETFAVESRAA